MTDGPRRTHGRDRARARARDGRRARVRIHTRVAIALPMAHTGRSQAQCLVIVIKVGGKVIVIFVPRQKSPPIPALGPRASPAYARLRRRRRLSHSPLHAVVNSGSRLRDSQVWEGRVACVGRLACAHLRHVSACEAECSDECRVDHVRHQVIERVRVGWIRKAVDSVGHGCGVNHCDPHWLPTHYSRRRVPRRPARMQQRAHRQWQREHHHGEGVHAHSDTISRQTCEFGVRH